MSRESKTAINFDPYGVLDTVWKSDNDIGALCLDKNKKKLCKAYREFFLVNFQARGSHQGSAIWDPGMSDPRFCIIESQIPISDPRLFIYFYKASLNPIDFMNH